MILLQNSAIQDDKIKEMSYLVQLSNKADFFIFQGKDRRTLMHRDVITWDGNTFKYHNTTFETYLGTDLLPCIGIIIPDTALKTELYKIRKSSGLDILEGTKMMTEYTA